MGRSSFPFVGAETPDNEFDKPPVAIPRFPPQPRRRRRGVITFGLLAVAFAGVLAYETALSLSGRVPVVVAKHDIPIGQRITLADVTRARVAVDRSVAVIPGAKLDKVIGLVAAVDLRRGALFTPSSVTDQLNPVAGQQLVPVAVKPSRLPARGLQPGDSVVIVARPEENAAGKSSPSPGQAQFSGVVDKVSGAPDADGLIVVDLLVAAADGPQISQQAADGRISFTLTSRRP